MKEHDTNLARFKELNEEYGLTLIEDKCVYREQKKKKKKKLALWSKGTVRPDPKRWNNA